MAFICGTASGNWSFKVAKEVDFVAVASGDPPGPSSIPQQVAIWIATGLGLCRVVPAPGTVGTALFGLPFAWAVGQLPGVGWQIAAIIVAVLVGVPLTTAANRALGGAKDHQAIVWDEIASMPIVFLLVPMANWKVALAGFVLHRIFDISKPPPARQLERLSEGVGIMADDLMAAAYAAVALGLLSWIDGSAGWGLLGVNRG
jgi:phosphatidylglycerophosphatase A